MDKKGPLWSRVVGEEKEGKEGDEEGLTDKPFSCVHL